MKKIGISAVLIILLILLCGCGEASEETLKHDKVNSELEYLESKIFFIVNQYYNNGYSEEPGNIMWDSINRDFSLITQNKSVIVMDLAERQTDGNLILAFENNIIAIQDAITAQNFPEVFKNLCTLYNFIPEFSKQTSQNENLTKIRTLKSNLLYSNYCVLISDFDSAIRYIEEVEKIYSNLLQSKEYIEKNSYIVNRKYVEIQEYKLAVQNQNLESIINAYFNLLSFM